MFNSICTFNIDGVCFFYRRIKKKNKTQRRIQVRAQYQVDIIVTLVTAQYPPDMGAFFYRGVLTSRHYLQFKSNSLIYSMMTQTSYKLIYS